MQCCHCYILSYNQSPSTPFNYKKIRMKLLPLILVLVTLSFTSLAQQIKENEVPANVREVASAQTNSHPVTMWVLDKKRGKYVASLISDTSMKGVEISLDGKWIETTEAILPSNVPAPVMRVAKDNFPDYELDNFFLITAPGKASHYSVDASSDDEDLTLTIDLTGKILKKEQR